MGEYKTYFYEWMLSEGTRHERRRLIGSLIVFTLIASMLFGMLSYFATKFIYKDELTVYPKEAWEELNQLADEVLQEGVGFDLRKLPSNTQDYELNKQGDNFVLWVQLENEEAFLAPNLEFKITVSQQYEELQRECVYSTAESYFRAANSMHIAVTISFVTVIIAGVFILMLVAMLLVSVVSYIQKKIDISKGVL